MNTTVTTETSWAHREFARDRLPLVVVRLLLLTSYVYVVFRLAGDVAGGGNQWRQGDWLINTMPGNLRRGPIGSLFLVAHDTLGLSPVVWVVMVQVALITVLYVTFASHLGAIKNSLLAALLAASPAMFWLFWMGDLQGSARKELIGFAAISLLLVWVRNRNSWVLGVATALMMLGGWGHEINLLLIPGFVYVWYTAAKDDLRRPTLVAPGLVVLSGLAAGVYVLAFSGATRADDVCAAVVERGVRPGICVGAISWIDKSPGDVIDQVMAENVTPSGLFAFVLVIGLSWAALAYLVSAASAKIATLLTMLLATPFVVLIITLDWGRWVSCSVFVVVSGLIARELTVGITLARKLNSAVVLVFVVLGLLATPHHVVGIEWGGVPGQILKDLSDGIG